MKFAWSRSRKIKKGPAPATLVKIIIQFSKSRKLKIGSGNPAVQYTFFVNRYCTRHAGTGAVHFMLYHERSVAPPFPYRYLVRRSDSSHMTCYRPLRPGRLSVSRPVSWPFLFSPSYVCILLLLEIISDCRVRYQVPYVSLNSLLG